MGFFKPGSHLNRYQNSGCGAAELERPQPTYFGFALPVHLASASRTSRRGRANGLIKIIAKDSLVSGDEPLPNRPAAVAPSYWRLVANDAGH
jgi:hypothetical protein